MIIPTGAEFVSTWVGRLTEGSGKSLLVNVLGGKPIGEDPVVGAALAAPVLKAELPSFKAGLLVPETRLLVAEGELLVVPAVLVVVPSATLRLGERAISICAARFSPLVPPVEAATPATPDTEAFATWGWAEGWGDWVATEPTAIGAGFTLDAAEEDAPVAGAAVAAGEGVAAVTAPAPLEPEIGAAVAAVAGVVACTWEAVDEFAWLDGAGLDAARDGNVDAWPFDNDWLAWLGWTAKADCPEAVAGC